MTLVLVGLLFWLPFFYDKIIVMTEQELLAFVGTSSFACRHACFMNCFNFLALTLDSSKEQRF